MKILKFLRDFFVTMSKELINAIEENWDICFHNYERASKTPRMRLNEKCHCQYKITYRCTKCQKEKEGWSDIMVGFELLDDAKKD